MSVYFIQANLQEQNKQQSVNRLNGHTGGIVYFVNIVSKKSGNILKNPIILMNFKKLIIYLIWSFEWSCSTFWITFTHVR